MFLEALGALLRKEPDLQIVGLAHDGLECVKLATEEKPDIVVVDVSMPGMNGTEATRRITTQVPQIKVLCLSMHKESQYVVYALEAGARGYLLKDCALEELVKAIRTLIANQSYLSPAIADTVLQSYRDGRSYSRNVTLTLREREVLQLIAEGWSTKDQATRLNVSRKTIETHRKQIMNKLGIYSIAELTKYAIRSGMTSIDD